MSDTKATNGERKGTFQVTVVFANPDDGTNADTMSISMWPGTAEGKTPPATWAEAVEYGLKNIDVLSKLPGGGVCELRITTFQQGSEEDHLAGDEDE